MKVESTWRLIGVKNQRVGGKTKKIKRPLGETMNENTKC
jgi:hypothetical protein